MTFHECPSDDEKFESIIAGVNISKGIRKFPHLGGLVYVDQTAGDEFRLGVQRLITQEIAIPNVDIANTNFEPNAARHLSELLADYIRSDGAPITYGSKVAVSGNVLLVHQLADEDLQGEDYEGVMPLTHDSTLFGTLEGVTYGPIAITNTGFDLAHNDGMFYGECIDGFTALLAPAYVCSSDGDGELDVRLAQTTVPLFEGMSVFHKVLSVV